MRRNRNGPFPLSLPILFSLSSRRDCRVSPPVTFVTRTRLCGSYPPCTASGTKDGRYPLRCPVKLGLSSHSGWTGRFPSLIICARSSEKTFPKICFQIKEQKKRARYPCLPFISLTVTRIAPISAQVFIFFSLKATWTAPISAPLRLIGIGTDPLKLIGIGTRFSRCLAAFQAALLRSRPNLFGDIASRLVQNFHGP